MTTTPPFTTMMRPIVPPVLLQQPRPILLSTTIELDPSTNITTAMTMTSTKKPRQQQQQQPHQSQSQSQPQRQEPQSQQLSSPSCCCCGTPSIHGRRRRRTRRRTHHFYYYTATTTTTLFRTSTLFLRLRFLFLPLLLVLLLLLPTVVVGILHVPSKSQSFPSMPSIYYGKPWMTSEFIPMSIYYLGSESDYGDDDHDDSTSSIICPESTGIVLQPQQLLQNYNDYHQQKQQQQSSSSSVSVPSIPPFPLPMPTEMTINENVNNNNNNHHENENDDHIFWPEEVVIPNNQQSHTNTNNKLPRALLVQDSKLDSYPFRSSQTWLWSCHLYDYESFAEIWNISYLLFYDSHPNRSIHYSRSILDSFILSKTNNSIGIQFISYDTGQQLKSWIINEQQQQQQVEQSSSSSSSNTTTLTATNSNGLIIQLDGTLATSNSLPPPRFHPKQVRRRIWVTIIPKITGLLSILGSSYILYDLLVRGTERDRTIKLRQTFHRLLIGLCCADILSSISYFLSHCMFPAQAPIGTDQEAYDIVFPWSYGTTNTCKFQGFLMQLGQHASVLFTAFISIQFVLMVRYQWTEYRMRYIERIFFMIGITFPFITSITMVSMGAMNPTMGGTCWISTYPYVCRSNVGWCYDNKVWGEQFSFYIFIMAYMWILIAMIIVILSMILLFLTVRTQERRASRWSMNAGQGRAQRAVFKTAILLIATYVLIYLTVFMSHNLTGGKWPDVLLTSVVPIQGFLNAIIYSKKYEPMLRVIRKFLPCCCPNGGPFSSMFTTSSNVNTVRSFRPPATSVAGNVSTTSVILNRSNHDPLRPCTKKSSSGIVRKVSFEDDTPLVGGQDEVNSMDGHDEAKREQSCVMIDDDDDDGEGSGDGGEGVVVDEEQPVITMWSSSSSSFKVGDGSENIHVAKTATQELNHQEPTDSDVVVEDPTSVEYHQPPLVVEGQERLPLNDETLNNELVGFDDCQDSRSSDPSVSATATIALPSAPPSIAADTINANDDDSRLASEKTSTRIRFDGSFASLPDLEEENAVP